MARHGIRNLVKGAVGGALAAVAPYRGRGGGSVERSADQRKVDLAENQIKLTNKARASATKRLTRTGITTPRLGDPGYGAYASQREIDRKTLGLETVKNRGGGGRRRGAVTQSRAALLEDKRRFALGRQDKELDRKNKLSIANKFADATVNKKVK